MKSSSNIVQTRMKDCFYRCSVGRSGIGNKQQEGDGITPIGNFELRKVFYRADRVDHLDTDLPTTIITPNMGWCDDVNSSCYNQFIQLPADVRHEKLWSDDEVYDIVVVVGYNDHPVIKGKGSAIFLHIARENYTPTEGCIAFKQEDLMAILKYVTLTSRIEITVNQINIHE